MEMIVNFRKLYFEAFENCGPTYLVILLKAYSIFCALMFTIVVYAFFYRAFTGFKF